MKFFKGLTLSAVALVATTAFAAVTYDPGTGKGFVGKGDVQIPFSLNNQTMQTKAQSTFFHQENKETYTFTCMWLTGNIQNIKQHFRDKKLRTDVAKMLASDPRKTGQWTGWNLNGFESISVALGDPIPMVGDACPGEEGNGARVSAVDPNPISKSVTLFATIDGVSKQIWPAPTF